MNKKEIQNLVILMQEKWANIVLEIGKRESEVIKIMRRSLKPSSFRLWRKRVHTKSIKNRKLFSKSREKLNKQKIINSDY